MLKYLRERPEDYNANAFMNELFEASGGWQVKGAGNSRATVRTSTQKEAIKIARGIAKNQQSEPVVHNRSGQIRAKDSFGNDLYPPKG